MSYKVNDSTLALLPNGYKGSQAIENKNNYILEESTFRVIEDSCEYFGVDYKSRVKNSTYYTNSRYKSPIVVQEANRIIFFPITSPTRNNTTWISFNNIEEYYPCKNKRKTIVVFKNGFEMIFDISFYSFNQQYLKASKINTKLVDRNFKK